MIPIYYELIQDFDKDLDEKSLQLNQINISPEKVNNLNSKLNILKPLLTEIVKIYSQSTKSENVLKDFAKNVELILQNYLNKDK